MAYISLDILISLKFLDDVGPSLNYGVVTEISRFIVAFVTSI